MARSNKSTESEPHPIPFLSVQFCKRYMIHFYFGMGKGACAILRLTVVEQHAYHISINHVSHVSSPANNRQKLVILAFSSVGTDQLIHHLTDLKRRGCYFRNPRELMSTFWSREIGPFGWLNGIFIVQNEMRTSSLMNETNSYRKKFRFRDL